MALAEEVVRLCEQPNDFSFSYELDCTIEEKIEAIVRRVYRGDAVNFTPAAMRQHFIEKDGYTVIEDCYNASPESMKAGLEVLCHTAKTKALRPVAVLGDMLELGKVSEEAHRSVGERVAKAGVAHLVTYGKAAKHIARGARENGMDEKSITILESDVEAQETAEHVRAVIQKGDVVLFKASRAMALERIVNLL